MALPQSREQTSSQRVYHLNELIGRFSGLTAFSRIFCAGNGIILAAAICDARLVSHLGAIGVVVARYGAIVPRVTMARFQLSAETAATNLGDDVLVAALIRPTSRESAGYNQSSLVE